MANELGRSALFQPKEVYQRRGFFQACSSSLPPFEIMIILSPWHQHKTRLLTYCMPGNGHLIGKTLSHPSLGCNTLLRTKTGYKLVPAFSAMLGFLKFLSSSKHHASKSTSFRSYRYLIRNITSTQWPSSGIGFLRSLFCCRQSTSFRSYRYLIRNIGWLTIMTVFKHNDRFQE